MREVTGERIADVLKSLAGLQVERGFDPYTPTNAADLIRDLRAERDALAAQVERVRKVQRYEINEDGGREDNQGDWAMWVDIEAALDGEEEQ